VLDQNGEAALNLITREVTSSDAQGGCRYFHCVAAAIFFLMDDPPTAASWSCLRLVSRGSNVSSPTLPDSCRHACDGARARSGLGLGLQRMRAAGATTTPAAATKWLTASANGSRFLNPAILERYNHYHCDNPTSRTPGVTPSF